MKLSKFKQVDKKIEKLKDYFSILHSELSVSSERKKKKKDKFQL